MKRSEVRGFGLPFKDLWGETRNKKQDDAILLEKDLFRLIFKFCNILVNCYDFILFKNRHKSNSHN